MRSTLCIPLSCILRYQNQEDQFRSSEALMPPWDQPIASPKGDPLPKPAPLPFPPNPPNTINIRLITDNIPGSHPLPQILGPLSPISPRPRPRRLDGPGPPILPPGRGPPSIIVERRPPPWLRKKDAFYKSWDKFTLQKDVKLGKWSSRKARQRRQQEIEEGVVPSLDIDVEGRPGHYVGTNEEGVKSNQKAGESYEQAAASCKAKVEAIVRECRRLNQKYYDRQFNLPDWDTLVHLAADESPSSVKDLLGVGAVKRVEDIFEEPEFFEDGPTPQDIRQGNLGNCYFLAALGALGGKPSLIEKLCVARDEIVGVYGFVFFRDGEWISEIVDDRLCLRYSDDVAKNPTDFLVVTRGDKNAMAQPLSDMSYAVQRLPKDFYQSLRKGSSALYFGSCRESNETWLPLIEKAYAKAHGDYQAIDGGVTGEGIEDLTGGVASFVRSENVLDKDKLWEELMQVNESFLFGCGTRKGRDSETADDEGFVRGHAYTVLAAHEIEAPVEDEKKKKKTSKKYRDEEEKRKKEITKDGKVRLLKLHNPWGRQEFNGDWSDSSNRWTPELLKELGHTIGDDGTFFISFLDFLKFFPIIDRIRLIGPEWTISQQWTAVNVPWSTCYLDTAFRFTVTKSGPVVLVLSQPDTRYFKGLTGRYKFSLHFRIYKEDDDTYMLRSMEQSGNMRSCNVEAELEAGTYELLLKITAERQDNKRTPQQVIRQYRDERREKLLAVGKSFDLTHSKGKLRDLEKQNLLDDIKEIRERAKERLSKQREIRNRQRKIEKKRQRRLKAEMKRKRQVNIKKHDEEVKEKREALMKEKEGDAKSHPNHNREREGNDDKQEDILIGAPPRHRRQRNDSVRGSHDTTSVDDSSASDDEIEVDTKSDVAAEEKLPAVLLGSGEPKSRPADMPPLQTQTPGATPDPSTAGGATEAEAAIDEEAMPPQKVVVFEPDQASQNHGQVQASTNNAEDEGEKEIAQPVPESQSIGQRDESPNYHAEGSPRALPGRQPRTGAHRDNDHAFEDDIYNVNRYQERRRPHDLPMRGPPLPPGHRPRGYSMGSEDGIVIREAGFPSPTSSVCDDDFSWDSDIDAPASLASSYDSGSGTDSLDEMYPHDPWQATCVIGLRVCSLDENVSIEVVRGSHNRHGHSEIVMGRARSPA